MNKLFITGMIRSGTTLLERMLNSHSEIVSVSEPFRPFYNLFYSIISQQAGIDSQDYEPIGDFFADGLKINAFKILQNTTFDRDFPDDKRESLLQQIKGFLSKFSEKNIVNNLECIKGKSFKDVLDNLMLHIIKYYANGNEKYIGTKEIWIMPFIPLLARTYPESRFIIIMRDPRGVIASKNSQKNRKNPWLYLARMWRELAILTWIYSNDKFLKERIYVISYEKMIKKPETHARKLCKFLNVEYDEAMIKPERFKWLDGSKWLQNSTFDKKETGFNTSSIDVWKRKLDRIEIEYIEKLCFCEMMLWGYRSYTRTTEYDLKGKLLLDPPMISSDDIVEWMKHNSENKTKLSIINDLGKEKVREEFFRISEDMLDKIDDEVIESYFLNQKYLKYAYNMLNNNSIKNRRDN